ncbi:MAG: hypothetical protein HQM10_02430 [Candidatus Riflebacteria bacterium]|nr:hypothetical protein [Candidatus Riflebacteria bacterium]
MKNIAVGLFLCASLALVGCGAESAKPADSKAAPAATAPAGDVKATASPTAPEAPAAAPVATPTPETGK